MRIKDFIIIQEMEDKRLFVNYGPIQMALDIKIGSKSNPEIGYSVGKYVLEQFDMLLKYMPQLKAMRAFQGTNKEYPNVLNKMISAVNKCEDESINYLGAVAGSFSDIALEKALELGATRVIINNGGDIACKDINGESIKVGIPLKKNLSKTQLILTITGDMEVGGVCTSGLGGRSFTKGIATASVVLASDAATADACATSIGNMTNVEDKNIIRCFAEEIDSETDISGQLVTLNVGDISYEKIYEALLNGLNASEKLYEREIIKGSVLCIKDSIVMIPENIVCAKNKY